MPAATAARRGMILAGQFLVVLAIFLFCAYWSVTSLPPSSIPVHHDDYSNYSRDLATTSLSVRPVSMLALAVLAQSGPGVLIWALRLLTALYVLLCIHVFLRAAPTRRPGLVVGLVSLLVFSSPIAAEYARYTGLLTHILSGCLAMSAILLLHRAFSANSVWSALAASIVMLASFLSKEDYLLAYLLAVAYFGTTLAPSRRAIGAALGALPLALAWMIWAKASATSHFLGVEDVASTYYLNVTPASMVLTAVRYLSGTGHPSMWLHGNLTIVLLVITVALCALIGLRRNHRALFGLGLLAALIAPYSLLPNHVNPYYELIWLPFLYLAAWAAGTAVATVAPWPERTATAWRRMGMVAALLLVASIAAIDTPGRAGVVDWYDQRGTENALVLERIAQHAASHPGTTDVCVFDAGMFSPYYMHGARYIESVLGIRRSWHLLLPDDSPLRPGFQTGESMGEGRISLHGTGSDLPPDCPALQLGVLTDG
jgi:hypothetical protein